MNYTAYNNYVIVMPQSVENKTDSGIITQAQTSNVYRVIATNETTKDLQDKLIVAKELEQLDAQHYAVDYQKIVAIKN